MLGEYLAEGALAPIFMIRRGAHKFIWSEPDPPLLFDLDRDPDELENLAAAPGHASIAAAFEAEVRGRWDPARLRAEILKASGRAASPSRRWQPAGTALGLPAGAPRGATRPVLRTSTTWSAGAASRRRIGRLEAAASSSMAHCSAATATANAIAPAAAAAHQARWGPCERQDGKAGKLRNPGWPGTGGLGTVMPSAESPDFPASSARPGGRAAGAPREGESFTGRFTGPV